MKKKLYRLLNLKPMKLIFIFLFFPLVCSSQYFNQNLIDSLKNRFGEQRYFNIESELINLEADSLRKNILSSSFIRSLYWSWFPDSRLNPDNQKIIDKYLTGFISYCHLFYDNAVDWGDFENYIIILGVDYPKINIQNIKLLQDYKKNNKDSIENRDYTMQFLKLRCLFAVDDYYGCIRIANILIAGENSENDLINILFRRSLSYFNTEQYPLAKKDFETLISLCKLTKEGNVFDFSRKQGIAHVHLGMIFLNEGKKQEGCLNFSAAAELGIDLAFDLISKYCH
jgi:hypothetical protein